VGGLGMGTGHGHIQSAIVGVIGMNRASFPEIDGDRSFLKDPLLFSEGRLSR
jgi:hypothetical protein